MKNNTNNAVMEISYIGPLKEACTDLVALKRAVGYKYNTQAQILKRFDSFVGAFNQGENILTKEVMDTWNIKLPHESDKTYAMRVRAAISLAKFMAERGFDAYIPQSNQYRYKPSPAFKPYIFTDNEVFRFFHQADCIPKGLSPYRHLVFPLIFRLYLCCGLRASEALHLKISDVDMENGILFIRDTKFNKDRLVPMAPELTQLCSAFQSQALFGMDKSDYFFPSPQGGPYSVKTINKGIP